MALSRLLVANRGEIAIRIMRAAADLGIPTVAVYPQDDSQSLHAYKADETVLLPGSGARAYLDIQQIVESAKKTGCDGVHPGYGFLAENAGFARALDEAGITFVGPTAETLDLFGDKVRARGLAAEHGGPVLPGPDGGSNAVSVPPDGSVSPSGVRVSMFTRAWMANPRGSGTDDCCRPSSARDRPSAIFSWASTRSMPVTASVTVCSTWSRALTSMK